MFGLMDVTPRELRDTDIREGFRGYHRDDVDELLERAAATIEALQERARQMTEKLAEAESRPVSEPASETEDILKRTLVLAQKAADDAVAEAQNRARQLLEESEAKSRRIVDQAEATARRIHESERARLEAEVIDLGSRRETLSTDVDALEKFEREYRNRLRAAVEAELSSLGTFSTTTDMGPRPEQHEVAVPSPSPPSGDYPGSTTGNAVEAFLSASSPPPAPSRPAPSRPEPRPDPRPDLRPAPRTEAKPELRPQPRAQAPAPAPAESRESAAPPAKGRGGELASYVPEDNDASGELDDDAFFATLREAVRDEAPLGSEDEDFDDGGFFDQDSDDAEAPSRRRFRRRR